MIVCELEAILAPNAFELGVCQPRLELIETCLCQATCGLRTQAYSLIADHRRTLAPTEPSVTRVMRGLRLSEQLR